MTLQLDSAEVARFDVRSFDLGVSQAVGAAPSGAEISVIKQAGPFTADLLRLGSNGSHAASATIEVLDSLGVASVIIRLTDVTVGSDHVRLSGARAALEQERISQQEALAQLTADYQEAQRQLATAEELGKSRIATRQDLARARERAAELQQRVELARQRQSLLARQIDPQSTLEECLVLRFGRVDVDTPLNGARVLRPNPPGGY